MQLAGTDSEVPLSSPRTLAVEDVLVTPRSVAADVSMSAVESASQHAAALATLNAANAAKMAAFTPTEQDSVHHTLYAGESAGASAAAHAGGSSSLFTPSRSSRICLSARANDLPSNTWMAETTTLLALFSIDTAASASKYQLVSQTEFVKDTNAPTFKHQFVLDRSDSRARAQTYMLRVYDVESEVIDEAAYLGLITFNLEELLQNCRSTSGGGSGGGGFVSVVLPWIHPTNARWHDQLVRAHSTVTLSLQIPVEAGSPAPPVSQSAHVYTRLVNYLAPNILAQNMDLTVEAVGGGGSGSGPEADLVSLWYRPRSTALFQMLGYVSLSSGGQSAPHTVFVVSNEQFLAEQADGVGSDSSGADQGFEVKVLAHQKSRLPGGGALALATARNAERALGASVNTPVTGGNTLASATRGGLVGAASVTFKTLLMALDAESALVLPLENGAGAIQLTLKTRRPIPEVNLVDDEEDDAAKQKQKQQQQALSVPSLPASIPPSVLTKAHELLRTGLYFTEYPAPAAVGAAATTAAAATAVAPLPKRDVLVRMIDGVAEGLGKATRLEWTVAATSASSSTSTPSSSSDTSSSSSSSAVASTPPSSMALARIDAIYGGRDSSPAFASAAAAGGDLPSSDVLFTIVGAGGQSLSLEAPSWQTRDTFIFSILSYQASCALPVALWHPAGLDSTTSAGTAAETTPRIVAQEPMATAVQEKKPQLGGSHGSLARTPAKAAAAASAASTSAGGKTASDAAVDLQEVLAKLEKLFEQGRNFIRFTSGAHQPHYISLFLRKDPIAPGAATSTGFGLYWCKADHRTQSSTRCLHSSEIVGLALGKQTAVFRKDDAALAPASHCFSIVGATRSLHLQSWNERDSDTYAFGIASLLKQYGAKPKLWQAGQYQAQESTSTSTTTGGDRLDQENQSEMREEPDGTQQVSPADIPTLANAQGYRCAIELVIKCRNLPVTKSTNNVIVCAFDRDDQTEKLAYLGQSEKQASRTPHPEFRKVFRLTYDSTVLRKLRFNVYDLASTSKQMDDEDRIGSAMMLLKEVVDGAGIEFVYRLTHENPAKQAALQKQGATIIIQCAAKSEMALDLKSTPTTGAAAASALDGSHNGARADSAQVKAWQHQLYTGDVFTLHYASRDPQSHFVFYVGGHATDPADLGSLFWCDVGTRHESPAASLALRDIVHVVVGNDRLAVTPFSSAIPSAICFTLVAADSHRVDVECRSQNQRDQTVQAIVGILRAGGKHPHVQEIA